MMVQRDSTVQCHELPTFYDPSANNPRRDLLQGFSDAEFQSKRKAGSVLGGFSGSVSQLAKKDQHLWCVCFLFQIFSSHARP